MGTLPFFVDIHCHPAMRPFGRSYYHGWTNSADYRDDHSIWHHDPPGLRAKLLNYSPLGLTKFTQASFSALAAGRVRVVVASLYPPEVNFFDNKLGTSGLSFFITNTATGLRRRRIEALRRQRDYFGELRAEYDFYRQLDGQPVALPHGNYRYVLVRNYADLEAQLADSQTICVVFSVEGAHAFNTGFPYGLRATDPAEVLANVAALKQWPHRPLFVTLAHIFENELCGHAASLSAFVSTVIDQLPGRDAGFHPLGYEVVAALLSEANGPRVHVDIKHMSRCARLDYYAYLDGHYAPEEIPIVVSHGAVTGLPALADTAPAPATHHFMAGDINFFDDELVRIARSGGIFGLQMDERRVGSRYALRRARRGYLRPSRVKRHRAALLWRQVQHVAEVLDRHGLPAWDHVALGSDYDGIIDPLTGYWTAADYPDLYDMLLERARQYLRGTAHPLRQPRNRLDAEAVMERLTSANALNFLRRFF